MKNMYIIFFLLMLCGFTADAALLIRRNATPAAVTVSARQHEGKKVRVLHLHRVHSGKPGHGFELPKGVYIAMSILLLGWLAIAIHDNFTQQDWIFALLLYGLLILPGIYYSLSKMREYYSRY